MSDPSIRVLSVDDHAFFIDGLKAGMDAEEGMELVGRLSSADRLIDEVRQTKPDVVVLDVHMPGPDVFEAIADLRRQRADVKAVLLSAVMHDHHLDSAYRSGAWGYFSKDDKPQDVMKGIRRVAAGEMVFPAEVLERIRAAQRAGGRVDSISKLGLLTPREKQILRMIGNGMSRTDIAEAISRSPMTVDNHRKSIMKKLEIHDRVELARFAIAEKLVEV